MENNYYLPREMNAVLRKCYRDNQVSDNLRLLLHKHVPVSVIEKPLENAKSNAKTVWLRNIVSQYKADAKLVEAARLRWQSYVDALKGSLISMIIDWRMVIGLGGSSVFETDMTVHPLYGLPFIPGSALKGLTRAWVVTEKNEKTQVPGPEGKAIALIERIFGNQREQETQHAGSVIFFDAILMNKNFHLTLDIMNPHYSDYYREGKPPSNDQKPVPVPFLTVGGQATFLFAIAPRSPFKKEDESDAQTALQWLQQALEEYGIGSKTSSGYGYMQEKKRYQRPEKLPDFQAGQQITGTLLNLKKRDDLQVRFPTVASHVLQYNPFSTSEVFIALIDKVGIATRWQIGREYTCSFLSEQVRDNYTVLICEPGETI